MMQAEWLWKLPLFVLLLFVSAFFSSSEAALFSLGRYRLQRLHRFSIRKFAILEKMLETPTRLISTLLVGNEIINSTIGVVGASIVYDVLQKNKEFNPLLPILTVSILLPILIIFGDLIPKAYGLKNAEKVVLWSAYPLWIFYRFIAPVRALVSWLPDQLLTILRIGTKSKSVSEDVFRVLVDRGHKEGVLDLQEKQLINNVFKIDDLLVSQVMTPIEKVTYLTESMSMEECLILVEKEGYSRYPVLNQTKTTVVGVVYAKDLIGSSDAIHGLSLKTFLRSPLIVYGETLTIELFFQFKMKRTHFASVVDQSSGKLLGVVTLEDVLEEIFGDLKDERDVK